MDASEMGKILQSVSPSLAAGYEVRNLKGKSLRSVYEEYLDAVEKRKKISLPLICFFAFILSAIIAIIAVYLHFFLSAPVVLGMVFLMIGASIAAYPVGSTINKLWKYNRIIAKCEEVFSEFEQSVKTLDPRMMTNRVYTEEFTRDILIVQAVRLLDAEKKFKEKRLDECERISSILEAGNWEVRCRDELEKLLKGAEKFGLSFNKKELFVEAKSRM